MFASNVFIPKYIGLGKSVSLGFGIVTKPKPEPEQKEGRKAVFNEL
jgi:hypothetical protein